MEEELHATDLVWERLALFRSISVQPVVKECLDMDQISDIRGA